MIGFDGILNDNGSEKLIRVYLDLAAATTYSTNFFVGNFLTSIIINKNTCVLHNDQYQYIIKKFEDEIIMAAREIQNIFHCLLPCIYKQKFFVVTDKCEVKY